MRVSKFFSRSTILALLVLAQSCGPNSDFKQSLPGVWAGLLPENGFKWCIALEEDGQAEVALVQWQQDSPDGAKGKDVRYVNYKGTWLFADGNRLIFTLPLDRASMVSSTEAAAGLPPVRISPAYYVKKVDETALRMTGDPQGAEGSWLDSTPIDSCSDYRAK